MEETEHQVIEILRRGEIIPVDLYIELNNSGIDPEYLINTFKKEETIDERLEKYESHEGLDPIQIEILNEFESYQSYNI